MSDWKYLNQHRIRTGPFASSDEDGFNGMFLLMVEGLELKCLASDGAGWKHVSVSLNGSFRIPSWDIMSRVKELFWEDEETVMQLHPPKSQYVNQHPGCLHLWSPTDPNVTIPLPDPILVGFGDDKEGEGSALVNSIIGLIFKS